MFEFDKSIKSVIKPLSDTNWHDLYELHEKYSLSPDEILNITEQMLSEDLIIRDGNSIKLIIENSKEINIQLYKALQDRTFRLKNDNYQEYIIPRLSPNSLYLPDLEKIDIIGIEKKR